jgi:hypothetical protein
MDRICSTHGGNRNVYRYLVGKPEEKRPLGRPRHGWEDNTTDLRKIVWVVWTGFMWFRIGTTGWLF